MWFGVQIDYPNNGSSNVSRAASAAKYIRSAVFWVVTQRVVVIPYQSFGTTYWYHLQVSGYPEMSARNYHNILRKTQKAHFSYLY